MNKLKESVASYMLEQLEQIMGLVRHIESEIEDGTVTNKLEKRALKMVAEDIRDIIEGKT